MKERFPNPVDKLGRKVAEGDRIAVAMSSGDSSVMLIGRVLGWSKARISVLWEGPRNSWSPDITAIHSNLRKFVVINEVTQ